MEDVAETDQRRPTRIISGGQSGADRGALEAARVLGIPIGGWCPLGGWAEDRPEPPGIRADYPELTETPDADPAERTRRNVVDGDATLILASADPCVSPGTELTREVAEGRGRPCRVIDPEDDHARWELRAWLGSLPPDSVLNVAGPRESEQPGIAAATRELLARVLARNGRAPS